MAKSKRRGNRKDFSCSAKDLTFSEKMYLLDELKEHRNITTGDKTSCDRGTKRAWDSSSITFLVGEIRSRKQSIIDVAFQTKRDYYVLKSLYKLWDLLQKIFAGRPQREPLKVFVSCVEKINDVKDVESIITKIKQKLES